MTLPKVDITSFNEQVLFDKNRNVCNHLNIINQNDCKL